MAAADALTRPCLLLRQVMTPDAIRAGIDPEGGLLLALAQMDDEGRWPDYSAYETFISARPDLLNRRTDDKRPLLASGSEPRTAGTGDR